MSRRRITRFIARLLAYWRMRSIEIELEGKLERLAETPDPIARIAQKERIQTLRERLSQARSDYLSLFPPGERMTWSNA